MNEGLEQGQLTSRLSAGNRINPETLASPYWQDILDQYASYEDPWEISVVKMAQDFQRQLKELQEEDFELSGRMVVSCAVLLRVKAQELGDRSSEGIEEDEFDDFVEPDFLAYEEFEDEQFVPTLEVPVKRLNRRAVTRDELEVAFEDAARVYRRREKRRDAEPDLDDPDWGLDLEDGEDLHVRLQRLYRKVKKKWSRGKKVLFSTLLNRKTKEEKFHTFLELLHLQSEGKVECHQEEPFSEILVEVGNHDDGE
ncbi:MAG: hypothetical protein ACLFVS_01530 [Candidatus Acetothermia bacterium]